MQTVESEEYEEDIDFIEDTPKKKRLKRKTAKFLSKLNINKKS